ncbi:unnamed protein product [Rotaria sordida]|uniref:GPR180/TMEM145 transmembrane domain-containing protein n=1 Tax=Rotaria sordida TaxID=392033 RepID=A0A813S080_9BILA|nr:unnamed protein product [Rotaria sordida]CAF0790291.1 unnamed protein product [Rotaria sordida]
MNFFSLLFITIIYLLNKTSSKIIFDTINTNINWLYLTKFSFHPIYGHIDINLHSLDNNTIKFFVLNKYEWKEIKNDLSKICLKNELQLNSIGNETNLEVLSLSFTSIGQMYFILSTCNSSLNTTDLSFAYKLILTNGNNLFMKHFSNDEQGILQLYIISTSIYTIILLIVLRYIYSSKTKSCLIINLYLISILFSWLNSLICFIEMFIFALIGNIDAFVFQLLIFLARLFNICAHTLFLFILILSAKGYLIICVHLKKKTLTEIMLIILLYIHVQIAILIIITTYADRVFINENIFIICDYIQMIMYLLTCLWFIISLILTIKNSTKTFYSFFIFSFWFLTNAIVILLNILDIIPNFQITILKAMTISIQCLTYCIFMFIIRQKTFLLRTKLNQINITYIDPTVSKSHIKEQLTRQNTINTHPSEFTNLCSIENTNISKFRMPLKSFETISRLEPRRDVLLSALTQSSIISSQPSICLVPRRLPPLKHND